LVHVLRLQWRPGKALVDIAHDRLGLVERKSVMLEGRNLGKRLARQVQLLAVSPERHIDQLVRHPLFRQREPRAPHMSAAGRAIDDRVSHCFSYSSSGEVSRKMRPREQL